MLQSYVIEVNGTFIGAAVPIVDGFRFRAVHPQVDDLDGWTWRTLSELRRATGHLFTTGQHVRQAAWDEARTTHRPFPGPGPHARRDHRAELGSMGPTLLGQP